ncbi:MAG: hypothetical protein U5N56_06605 [Candidatus Marinimicrobia bacterium]|nr:hypothetical protein [Candidatus Neomarinimicrobiota bacterium]
MPIWRKNITLIKMKGALENEAVGSVISEFGNIDELLNELAIEKPVPKKTVRTVSKQEAMDWLDRKRRSGLMVAFGVFLNHFRCGCGRRHEYNGSMGVWEI